MGLLDNLKGVIGDEGINLLESASKGAIGGASKAAIDAVGKPDLAPPTTKPVDVVPPSNLNEYEEATSPTTQTDGNDNISKLFRLQEMLQAGLIDEAEFQVLKKQLFV